MNRTVLKRQRNSRGLAMPAALLILFLMVVLVGGLMGIVSQELREVAYTGFDNRALYVADAGVQEMVSLAEEQNPAPATAPPTYQFAADPNGLFPQYTLTILAKKYINNRRAYLIQSQGTSSEGYNRYVDALALEDTFARYNYAGWSNAPGNYFVSGLMQFNGPVYLGGASGSPVNVWWKDGNSSIFLDQFTGQGTVNWYTSGGASNPTTTADWLSVASGGKPAYQHVTNPIGFPPNASNIVIANEAYKGAYGATMPAPSGNGVFLNQTEAQSLTSGSLTTGIYVNGDANVTFAATAAGASPNKETITFAPPGTCPGGGCSNPITKTTTVTVNYTSNQTTVQEGSSAPVTLSGVPSGDGSGSTTENGAIYVNGKVAGLSGTMAGQQTLAVPDNTDEVNVKDIVITGNLSYQNDPQTCGCTSTDMLGLIGHNVYVDQSAPANLLIEAAVFAGNSQDYALQNGKGTFATNQSVGGLSKKGPLLVYGSLVNSAISPLGVFDSSTGQLVKGWGDNYTWDSRYKTTSPPFYPSLNTYTIIGWTDCGSNACP